MSEWMSENWWAILIAIAVIAVLLFLLLRPKQRVSLSDSTPVRPHMVERRDEPRAGEGNSIADEMAAATSDVTGDIIDAPVHSNLPGASGPPDDLQKLKGVGPKFAQVLNQRGITRFEQLAKLNPHQIERLDAELGAFRGRLQRDRVTEQADYLARGDTDGFEHHFGKL